MGKKPCISGPAQFKPSCSRVNCNLNHSLVLQMRKPSSGAMTDSGAKIA